jgi:hypothetical protein
VHAGLVADELSARESAFHKLPLPYSLALRLRDAGVHPRDHVAAGTAQIDGLTARANALGELDNDHAMTVSGEPEDQ